MKIRIPITVLSAAAGVLAFASQAEATTFCVPDFHAACPNNGTNVASASLEAAMSADGNDGIPDTVLLDATTVTDSDSVMASGHDPLLVRGAGAASRVTSSTSANAYVVNRSGVPRQITLRNLSIVVPASMPDNQGAAIQGGDGDKLEGISLISRNPGSNAVASWVGSGSLTDGQVFGEAGGSFSTGVRVSQFTTAFTLERSRIEGATGEAVDNEGSPNLTVRRSIVVDPAQGAIVSAAGTTNVLNTVVRTKGTPGLYGIGNSSVSSTLFANHVTAINNGAKVAAVASQVLANQSGNASVTVANSIFRGYNGAFSRQAPTGAATGNASVSISSSNVHVKGDETSTGDGSATLSGNIDADPLFVSASDPSLQVGSPSIDAAAPGGNVTDDFLGAPRPVDGDGNGTATADQGAYEYQLPVAPGEPGTPQDPGTPTDPKGPEVPGNPGDTTPPETKIVKAPKAKLRGRTARFEFSSEPGAGFRCVLDGKALAACSNPLTLKHLGRARHQLTVAAVDAAGNVDPTPAMAMFKVVGKKPRRH